MRAIKIHEKDNVAVVLQPSAENDVVEMNGETITVRDRLVPVGHKIALEDIRKGEAVIKYGRVIGLASADILRGQHVHCHNVQDITEQLCNSFAEKYRRSGAE